MELKHILFCCEHGIGWIRFNRPKKLNALNTEVFKKLGKVISKCETDDSVWIIVLTGDKKSFIAGADIHQMAAGDVNFAYNLTDLAMHVQERLADLPKPTIAAISGFALGGGLEIALCCDFRLAADNAVMGLPEINLGIIPGGGGTQRLTRLINHSNSAAMIMLGETIKAKKAEQLGLVDRVVPLSELDKEVKSLAIKLMEKPSIAIRAAKTAIRKGLNVSLKDGLQIEQDLFCMLFGTQDQKEGMTAFIEKREPFFSGK